MSYDYLTQKTAQAGAETARALRAESDYRRGQFLIRLDNAADQVRVNFFEAGFIEDFLEVPEQARAAWWTPKRRDVADKLIAQYEHKLR